MVNLRLASLLVPFCSFAGQLTPPTSIIFSNIDPSGFCNNGGPAQYNYVLNRLWFCLNGLWAQFSSGGGGGSVFPITVSGTVNSGGIPYFSSATSEVTTALLAANAVVIGGGVGTAPSTIAADTNTTHALFATGSAPVFRALVTTDLPVVASSTATSNAQTVVGTGSILAASSNANRKRLIVQNIGTTVIYVLYGTGTASSSNYTYSLPACGVSKDGSSAPVNDTQWTGAVQWAGSANGGLAELQELL